MKAFTYFCEFNLFPCTGVKSVDANVEAKTVIVEAHDSVTPESMLEELTKVRSSAALVLFFVLLFLTNSNFRIILEVVQCDGEVC
jgi:hypothetical protein